MIDWIRNAMDALGYVGITLLMLLENIFPPIPSEVVMPAAGVAVAQGDLNFVGVVVAGALGSVLGALPFYYLGYYVGGERLQQWADKHGHWIALSSNDVQRAEAWFNRHGTKIVLFARLIPTVRTLISVPAGMAKMNIVQFLVYTTIGTGLWAAFLAYLGRALGNNYDQIQKYLDPIGLIIIVVLVIAGVFWVWKRKQRQS